MLVCARLQTQSASCNCLSAGSKANSRFVGAPRVSLAVRVRYKQNGQGVEHKHERQIDLRARTGSCEFLPCENSPQSSHHRRGLSDGIRDRKPRGFSRDNIEYGADAPDETTGQAQKVSGRRAAKESAKADRFADQWFLHEIQIPDKTREQSPQR